MNLFSNTAEFSEQLDAIRGIAAGAGTELTGTIRAAIKAVLDERSELLRVLQLAREVREAQRFYFKDRTGSALEQSKLKERQLDAALKEVPKP